MNLPFRGFAALIAAMVATWRARKEQPAPPPPARIVPDPLSATAWLDLYLRNAAKHNLRPLVFHHVRVMAIKQGFTRIQLERAISQLERDGWKIFNTPGPYPNVQMHLMHFKTPEERQQ